MIALGLFQLARRVDLANHLFMPFFALGLWLFRASLEMGQHIDLRVKSRQCHRIGVDGLMAQASVIWLNGRISNVGVNGVCKIYGCCLGSKSYTSPVGVKT